MKRFFRYPALMLLLSVLSGSVFAQNLYKTTKQLWKPQHDQVY